MMLSLAIRAALTVLLAAALTKQALQPASTAFLSSDGTDNSSWLSAAAVSRPSAEMKRLGALVKDHAKDNMVVLTVVNHDYKEAFLNWAVRLAKYGFDDRVVVVALDAQIYEFIKGHGFPSVLQEISLVGYEDGVLDCYGHVCDDATRYRHAVWLLRVKLITFLLREAKVTLLLSDVDALWMRPDVLEYINAQPGDIVSSRGWFPADLARKWGSSVCLGFAMFRPSLTQTTLERYEAQVNLRHDDQVALNRMLEQSNVEWKTADGDRMDYQGSSKVDKGTFDAGDGKIGTVTLIPHNKVARICQTLGDHDRPYVMHCTDAVSSKDDQVLRKDWLDVAFRGNRNAWLKEIAEDALISEAAITSPATRPTRT